MNKMAFNVTVLGNNSAVPSYGRNPAAQVLQMGNDYFLIDCGEGTQLQMNKFEIKRNRINHIFISHLHGDHFFGLIALLSTYSLLHREKPLHIFCHEPLKAIIDLQLKYSGGILNFPIEYHFLNQKHEVIFENKFTTVESIPLSHRIDCCGFLFKEKTGERKIIKSQIDKYNVPIASLNKIKHGEDFTNDKGETISNSLLTSDPEPSKSYAYISDTCYLDSIPPILKNTTCLYHEATFKNDDALRAKETFHCTATDAATIALKSNVEKLLVGHFSAKYKEEQLQELLLQAREIFPNSYLTVEGETIDI